MVCWGLLAWGFLFLAEMVMKRCLLTVKHFQPGSMVPVLHMYQVVWGSSLMNHLESNCNPIQTLWQFVGEGGKGVILAAHKSKKTTEPACSQLHCLHDLCTHKPAGTAVTALFFSMLHSQTSHLAHSRALLTWHNTTACPVATLNVQASVCCTIKAPLPAATSQLAAVSKTSNGTVYDDSTVLTSTTL